MLGEPWTDTKTPALAIVARGDQIEQVSPLEWKVHSQSKPGVVYDVRVARGRFTCLCEFAAETKRECIHQKAVKVRAGLQETKPADEGRPPCESCGSGDVMRAAKRRNKSGTIQRYRCRTCGAYFTGRDGFQKRRADPAVIARALDLYFRGVSLRQVAAHLEQTYGLTLSPMTVYRWITHYSGLAAEWMDRQKAQVGDHWNLDETMISVNGQKEWVWNLMDAQTRYLLVSNVSRTRTMAHTRATLHKAKHVTDVRPTEIRTDGMPAYPVAIRREFGRYRRAGDAPRDMKEGANKANWTPHVVVPSIRAAESNNLVERLNGSQRDRTKTMRGYDNERGTIALTRGLQVQYNLIRDHLSLRTTPGVAAGLPEINGFRWLEVLKLATRRQTTGAGTDGSTGLRDEPH
ncbi:MAG: transposase [Candidatus Lutacidiplasmatales archaeon]